MKIEVIKSGEIAEAGIHIRQVVKGVDNFNDSFAEQLIKAGWAKACKEEEKEPEEKKEVAKKKKEKKKGK